MVGDSQPRDLFTMAKCPELEIGSHSVRP